ncbi:hypothetical protein [Leptospira idonii]|uniref:hypothetical protein n=1 Tax=Leptospira idonii TaxID=1193500 RepID=UPI00143832A1|nr:hypothetical protein [Leptospira idonii]
MTEVSDGKLHIPSFYLEKNRKKEECRKEKALGARAFESTKEQQIERRKLS